MANNFKDFITDMLGSKNTNLLGTTIGKEAIECYYKDLAISMCINLIANSLSECTIRTYENHNEVQGEEYYVLNVRPNINENSSILFHKAIEKMILEGEALIVNIKGSLYVADSYSYDEYPIKGNIYHSVRIGDLSLSKKFKQDDVVLLRLNNVNIKKQVDNLYKSYGQLLKYCIENYKLSNQEKYILEMDNVKVGDRQFNERFKELINSQLEDFLGNQKAILPLYKGQTLTDVSKTNGVNSADFQSLVEGLFKTVAQAFNIPVDLLFSRTNNNINQNINQFLTFCINPIACMLEEELSNKLYDGLEGFKQGNFVRVDTSDIIYVNILDMATSIDKLISSGAFTINEIRDITGYSKIEEEFGDIHFITKNYSTMDNMLNPPKIEENLKGGEKDEE